MSNDNTPQQVKTLLSDCMRGQCCEIVEVPDRVYAARLKSMGICIGRTVEVVKHGDPLILKVYGARIGLAAKIAREVEVHMCDGMSRCWERNHGD